MGEFEVEMVTVGIGVMFPRRVGRLPIFLPEDIGTRQRLFPREPGRLLHVVWKYFKVSEGFMTIFRLSYGLRGGCPIISIPSSAASSF